MKHLAFAIYDVVDAFEFTMAFYFTLPTVILLLSIGGSASVLIRRWKPFLLTASTLAGVYCCFLLSQHIGLTGKLLEFGYRF